MELLTHKEIDSTISGKLVELDNNRAIVKLETKEFMRADSRGLVHGGFTFSAADFAAMAAVNSENVVLVSANVSFLAPVVVGDEVIFKAEVIEKNGKKSKVQVVGYVKEKEVFKGEFFTYSPSSHILDR
ncbi:MAG: thioesterase [Epsilonproteobacteria bacterium]|nr:thioesterase [Campylobacterota bacterium]